ncbi:Fur family transcriptional regulator [Aciduricibacillus chroicocephali]|uniref:Fur family transcriptional regulator n=1 Tax=Aciduricibacillus chroicocephali TaxID=3054939 RepID=A0ABY9KSM2_9BACI|nr:Fur family transcriptional regulator [Bacillaceae bacterium 44XB]
MNFEKAINRLKENGYKMTDKRKDMLNFFLSAGGYRTAKELNEYMEERYEGISFDTVYRNLNTFAELDILEMTELDGEKHFQISCSDSHHHHFICRKCGRTKEINICPMDRICSNLLNGYEIESHKFEVYGICPECRCA